MEEKTPDVGSVIRVLSENPALLGQIRRLLDGQGEAPRAPDAGAREEEAVRAEEASAPAVSIGAESSPLLSDRGTRLLRALAPYLSPGRGQAIETAIGLARIFDSVRSK